MERWPGGIVAWRIGIERFKQPALELDTSAVSIRMLEVVEHRQRPLPRGTSGGIACGLVDVAERGELPFLQELVELARPGRRRGLRTRARRPAVARAPSQAAALGRRIERRVLPHDRHFELVQWLARDDAEILVRPAPEPLEGRQRITLPTGPVLGQHELGMQLLMVRVVPAQLVQLDDDLGVLSGGETRVDEPDLDVEPELTEPPGVLVEPAQAGQLGQ